LVTLQKWLVDVKCAGCKGLFYRSEPHVIVPDADWPRNGDIVVGHEIPDVPGWIRLQNGYYLPMHSDDGQVQFLQKVSTRTNPSNSEMKRIGSGTPLFRAAEQREVTDIASLLENKVAVAASAAETRTVATEDSFISTDDSRETVRAAIHMDAMAFGMGCCCLQITFQAKDIDESRFIYDQLAVMAPIMMALTASTPFLRGRIADTDARWGIISESVDDRTLAERGRPDPLAPHDELAGKGQRRLYKSRYDCISTYIYQGAFLSHDEREANKKGLTNRVLNMYNDIPVPIEVESYKMLREAGIDPALSQHVAHLFVRDPLVIFEGAVEEVDDETQTEHWESIQSTNWQSVRWKPPPPRNSPNDPHIGWRTEFRTMEIQLTDFENAAFTAFTVLLTRVILAFDLNLYIPLSRVDANMQRAHSRNAAAKGKFFFRRHMAPLEEGDDGYGITYSSMFSRAVNGGNPTNATSSRGYDEIDEDGISRQRRTAPFAPGSDEENSYEEMTMAEIMCGKGDYFPGLIPLVHAYLDYINCDSITRQRLNQYLDLIKKRASGELVTPATWMRNFVRSHPAYKGDSVISDEIAYDLVQTCTDIGLGKSHIPELLGNVFIDPITAEGAYEVKLDSKRAHNERILELLKRYKTRGSFRSSFISR
jgi:glutamate--cysteine ligase catalytic subunit